MSIDLNPYLSFDGNAREAMEFYADVLGATLTMNTFGEFGEPDMPGADGIMHADLEGPEGLRLMGADMPPGEQFQPGNSAAVSLSGDDADTLRGWFGRLAEGGTVAVPLELQMWGDEFGMCVDRFGVSWMVNIRQSA